MGRERQRRNSALTLGCPLQQTGQWGRGGGEHPRLRGVHSSPLANRTERNRHKGSLQPPALDASWWGWAGASCPSWAEGWDCIQNRTAWDPIKKKKKRTLLVRIVGTGTMRGEPQPLPPQARGTISSAFSREERRGSATVTIFAGAQLPEEVRLKLESVPQGSTTS